MQNLLGIVLSYIFIVAIIILAKFFEKFGEETSRKFIHIMLANWYFIAMYFFTNWICACIVPLSFIIINYISYKKNLALVSGISLLSLIRLISLSFIERIITSEHMNFSDGNSR